MDPQIRLLLQTSWHALEDAGYAMNKLDVPVGNFCGMSTNSYLFKILETNSLKESVDPLLYRILNGKDFLATWISHKLNLTGPTMTLQTACSTSLLAVHMACQSLLNQECTMAIAGGVCYDANDTKGYIHVPESIFSKDGLCRPFDKAATGTIMGDGVGTILLKRAEDAIRDKDNIYALIKGTATNNDGANKQGYTTPSVDFQRDMILETLAVGDINPETIGMIEAHGTGTLIGDPIEISALTEAFREYTEKEQYCAVGSVKSNIGHLDAAAGIASIIKASLCVQNGIIAPSINFSSPNPALELESSPFYVCQKQMPWPDHFDIRRAGISSLGVGGTNVHVVIEEAPERKKEAAARGPFVVRLSAMNENSLQLQRKELAAYIQENRDLQLEDIEYTNIYGRKVMPYRFSLVCQDKEELVAQLNGTRNEKCYQGYGQLAESVFLFPGQGSQYTNMAIGLYEQDEAFRKDMDYCFDYVKSLCDVDFKKIIFSDNKVLLNQTEKTQLSLFIVEYCLAKKLMRTGIKPDAVIGHSLGEYVAACIVDCIALEDALRLVYHRGRLMGMMPTGDMVLVKMTEEELRPILLDSITICAFNAADNLVVGGTSAAVKQQIMLFEQQQVKYKKLRVSHAYHTSMMDNVLKEYEAVLDKVSFKPFTGKVFSTYTGALVSPELFSSRQYWLDQIINPVKFSEAAKEAMNALSNPVFIEVGPGSGLTSFVRSIFDQQANTVNLLLKSADQENGLNSFYEGKALLCAKGLVFDLPESHQGKRISLPGYVFAKNYFWKPQKNIRFNDFEEIKESYHFTNEKYLAGSLKSSIEIQINKGNELSEEQLGRLNKLHTEYLEEVKKLFSGEPEKVEHVIELLCSDVSFKEDTLSSGGEEFNKSRNRNSVFVEPTTQTEKDIARDWGLILGYQPVGILDNYFEVGGNSLLATQLINKIMKDTGIELTIAEVLSYNTVKDLAGLVEEKKWLNSDAKLSNELVI